MDREKFLKKLFPLIGGKENTSLCEFQDDVLYVTLKDAGLAAENAVAKLPDVASVTLRRGRLTITFGEPERKEEVPFMVNKNTDYRALAKEILANVGGKENVTNCFHCMTRLRFNLKDMDLANIDAIKKLNVLALRLRAVSSRSSSATPSTRYTMLSVKKAALPNTPPLMKRPMTFPLKQRKNLHSRAYSIPFWMLLWAASFPRCRF